MSATLLLFTVLVVLLPAQTYAFGAGDIPDFSYLNDKAFRHGDIENVLEELIKSAGGIAAGGGLFQFAHSVMQQATGGAKFSRSDVKKVYFGNWLRDYSQAMDIAGLSKLTADTLVLIVSILGFMTFGFATEEFEVTADRLGVYLPVEHIDNPKGYAQAEGDARRFHPKLRPPVQARELEFDERTGMKKYMATENEGFDTSTAFVRRTFRACIEHGRNAGGREGGDLWEAYRLLGQGLHTMEDLLAHSNWCEVALRKMGYERVFCHVGDNVVINTPNGRAPPLVTGTFGGADFIHSLMGEATDHLSQASVTDLSQKMSQTGNSDSNFEKIKDILHQLPIGGGASSSTDKMSQGEHLAAASKGYNFDPNNVAPPEVQRQLLNLLIWRDGIYRDFIKAIETVPMLNDLMEELTNALNAYVYMILAPYVAPILSQATSVLGEGSKAVIESGDQFEVFNNPNASDPTHSFLSKDHFALILNEPAGKIARLVVRYTVGLIVEAWSNEDENPDRVIDRVLEAFHHPYYNVGRSGIQHDMYEELGRWVGGLGPEGSREVIELLTKENVKEGRNKRPGSENQTLNEPGHGPSHSHGAVSASSYNKPSSAYGGGSQYNQPSYGSGGNDNQNQYGSSGYGGGGGGRRRDDDDSRNQYKSSGYGGARQELETPGYGGGGRHEEDSQYGSSGYGGGKRHDEGNRYGSTGYGGRQERETTAYGGAKRLDEDNQYGSSGYGGRRQEHESTGYGEGRRHNDDNEYGSSGRKHESETQYGSTGYGSSGYGGGRQEHESSGYVGGREHNDDYDNRKQYGSSDYGSSGRRHDNDDNNNEYGRSQYGSSGHGGRRDEDEDESKGRHHGQGHEPSRYGGGGNTYDSSGGYGGRSEGGYGGSSGRGGGSGYGRSGDSETFGAERMKIRDGDSDDEKKKKKKHGGRRNDDSDDDEGSKQARRRDWD